MIKTDTKNVNEVIERLSRSALLCDDNTNCTVTKNDLAVVLLAYQLELSGNADKSSCSEKNTSARLFREAVLTGARQSYLIPIISKGVQKKLAVKEKLNNVSWVWKWLLNTLATATSTD